MNKVILLGNITSDIELNYLQSGTAVAKTSMAVNKKYKLNGEDKQESMFINLTFWGKTAEIANKYVGKGHKLLIEGELKQEVWQDRQGNRKQAHSISVQHLELLPNKPKEEQTGGQNYQAKPKGQGWSKKEEEAFLSDEKMVETEVVNDKELPF